MLRKTRSNRKVWGSNGIHFNVTIPTTWRFLPQNSTDNVALVLRISVAYLRSVTTLSDTSRYPREPYSVPFLRVAFFRGWTCKERYVQAS